MIFIVIAALGASEPNLGGIFTGTDWAEEVQHTFNFGEGAESENALADYAPGDFYRKLYILDVVGFAKVRR